MYYMCMNMFCITSNIHISQVGKYVQYVSVFHKGNFQTSNTHKLVHDYTIHERHFERCSFPSIENMPRTQRRILYKKQSMHVARMFLINHIFCIFEKVHRNRYLNNSAVST